MALEIKLTVDSVAAKAASIKLIDATGAYNITTNPTGYGVENLLLSPSTTDLAYLIWKYWGSTTSTDAIALSIDQIADIEGDGLDVTPYIATLSTSLTDVFADGVHQIKFIPAQAVLGVDTNPTVATLTEGSKLVVLTNSDTVADIYTAGGAYWLIVDGVAYEIDPSVAVTDDLITLIDEYEGTTGDFDLILGAEGDKKALVIEAAEACIVSSIGKLGEREDCTTVEREINKLIRWKFSAGVQFDCADYEGAHNLALAIGKICNSGKCICSL